MQTRKTDNHNLPAKLELRRHFLRRYHAGQKPSVLDCCQGDGKIWRMLKSEFRLAHYLGFDLKERKGRLKLDSIRFLDQPGWTADVVDIDTYGSPWKHWLALLRHCDHPVTVFLTLGLVRVAGGNFDHYLLPILGLTFHRLKLPNSLGCKLSGLALDAALAAPSANGLKIIEAMEAESGRNARYFGLRLAKS